MAGTIIFGGIGLLCLIWGIVLCTGRGAGSVAGINTATPEELANTMSQRSAARRASS